MIWVIFVAFVLVVYRSLLVLTKPTEAVPNVMAVPLTEDMMQNYLDPVANGSAWRTLEQRR
jgi:hypothetical protein